MSEDQNQQQNDQIFTKIFQNLNFTDLKNCRLVLQNWNKLITESSDEFLASGIFHVTLESSENRDVLFKTKVKWLSLRLNSFQIGQESLLFHDSTQVPAFFQGLQTLEFHESHLSGETLRLFLIHCPLIENLIVTRCKFVESPTDFEPESLQEQDFLLGNVSTLRGITISNIKDCIPIINLLGYLNRWQVKNLQFLKIYFHPQGEYVSSYETSSLLILLERLIAQNVSTLEYLILNIRCSEILNEFGHYVLRELQPYNNHLKLKVFKLAEPMWTLGNGDEYNGNVSITSESQYFLMMFTEFLSKQTQLKSIAFPHLANLGGLENRRWQILEQVSKNIEKIRVPGPNYVRRNFLKLFTSLKVLFVGEKVVGGPGQVLHPCKFLYDFRRGGASVKPNTSNVHALEIYSKVNYEPGNLYHILEKFPLLTTFKLDCFRPLLNDRDVQAIIKYLENLRELSIVHCDLITDAGISGLPLHLCQELFTLGTIYTYGNLLRTKDFANGSHGSGKSLSDLKCLRSLKLIGKSGITDVGIRFGIRFINLRELHLPRNGRITEWGIRKIGQFNPCLESLTLTGINRVTTSGLTEVLNTHQRIQKDKSKVVEHIDLTNGNGTGSGTGAVVNTVVNNSSMLSAVLFTSPKK